MLQFSIIDAKAARRNELALALQSVGGWNVDTYSSVSAALNSKSHNDYYLLAIGLESNFTLPGRCLLYGESKPAKSLSLPFFNLYPLPACVEQIRLFIQSEGNHES